MLERLLIYKQSGDSRRSQYQVKVINFDRVKLTYQVLKEFVFDYTPVKKQNEPRSIKNKIRELVTLEGCSKSVCEFDFKVNYLLEKYNP